MRSYGPFTHNILPLLPIVDGLAHSVGGGTPLYDAMYNCIDSLALMEFVFAVEGVELLGMLIDVVGPLIAYRAQRLTGYACIALGVFLLAVGINAAVAFIHPGGLLGRIL